MLYALVSIALASEAGLCSPKINVFFLKIFINIRPIPNYLTLPELFNPPPLFKQNLFFFTNSKKLTSCLKHPKMMIRVGGEEF